MKKSFSLVLALCMVLSLFATFVLPAAAEEAAPVADGDNVVIYCPEKELAISAEEDVYNNQHRLAGTKKENGAVFTVDVTDDGVYFLYDGKYLTSGATGSNLTLEAEANEYSIWVLEEAENGWYIKNLNAMYNNTKPQYIEYYYAFTTYSLNTNNAGIYTFQFIAQEDDEPVTSQVVTYWNVSDWNTTELKADGAHIFTDSEAYLACTHTWWFHTSFKPTETAGVYEVVETRGATGTAATFEIPEGGFIWVAQDTAAAGTAGAYAYGLISTLAVGDKVEFTGIDIANKTTAADATAQKWGVEEDADSFKETCTYVDGVNVGTIQQLGEEWADKPASDFWYYIEDGEDSIVVYAFVDNREVVENDTQLRIWVDADMSDTARTTLFDFKVADGAATCVRADADLGAAVTEALYDTMGNDYGFKVTLNKATLGIDGEYGLAVTISETDRTTMHSIKYDNVSGSGQDCAPWNTTEFYEVFGGDNTGDESDTSNGEGTPEMGDASIAVVAVVMLVAMAGVVVVAYRRRRA